MKKKVELIKEQVNYLADLPEQGMGYQIVEVTLRNGQVLKNRTVVNSTFLLLNDNEQIKTDDIASIKLDC